MEENLEEKKQDSVLQKQSVYTEEELKAFNLALRRTQNPKVRVRDLTSSTTGDLLSRFYPLSVEEKTKVELALCETTRYEYKGKSFEGDINFDDIHNDLRKENLKSGTINNRRQTSFNVITLQDSINMVMAKKEFKPAQSYTFVALDDDDIPYPDRKDRIDIAFGEGEIDGKRHVFSKQTQHKLKEKGGKIVEVLKNEVSMYVMDKEKNETLLFRFDSSSKKHDNLIFLGSKPGQIFDAKVNEYHIHFQSLFVNSICHDQAFKNGAPTHGVAVEISNLSEYLTGLDLKYLNDVKKIENPQIGNKSFSDYADWDLENNYSLPFKTMQEMQKFPQVDLSAIVDKLESNTTNKDIKDLCENYRVAFKEAEAESFQKLAVSLDFLSKLEKTVDGIYQTAAPQELMEIRKASNEVVSTIADGLASVQQLEKQNINEVIENVEYSIAKESEAQTAAVAAENTAKQMQDLAAEAAKAAIEEQQRLIEEAERQRAETERLAKEAEEAAKLAQTKAAEEAAKAAADAKKQAEETARKMAEALKIAEEEATKQAAAKAAEEAAKQATPEAQSLAAARALVDNVAPTLTSMSSMEQMVTQTYSQDDSQGKIKIKED